MKSVATIQCPRVALTDTTARISSKACANRISVGIIEREHISYEGLSAIIGRMSGIERSDYCHPDESNCAYVDRVGPDVLVLSHDEQISALELEEVCQRLSKTRVLLLVSSRINLDIPAALRSGISGILSKRASSEELSCAIHSVSRGDSYLSQEFSPRLMARLTGSHLTSRESSVLNELAIGHSSKQISRALNISEGTVKSHIKKIFEKLEANSRSQAVFLAAQRGLLPFLGMQSFSRKSSQENFGENHATHL